MLLSLQCTVALNLYNKSVLKRFAGEQLESRKGRRVLRGPKLWGRAEVCAGTQPRGSNSSDCIKVTGREKSSEQKKVTSVSIALSSPQASILNQMAGSGV